jgi:hypothetical protein
LVVCDVERHYSEVLAGRNLQQVSQPPCARNSPRL